MVDRDNQRHVVGYLGRPGILAARLRRFEEENLREPGWFPLLPQKYRLAQGSIRAFRFVTPFSTAAKHWLFNLFTLQSIRIGCTILPFFA